MQHFIRNKTKIICAGEKNGKVFIVPIRLFYFREVRTVGGRFKEDAEKRRQWQEQPHHQRNSTGKKSIGFAPIARTLRLISPI